MFERVRDFRGLSGKELSKIRAGMANVKMFSKSDFYFLFLPFVYFLSEIRSGFKTNLTNTVWRRKKPASVR